MTIVQYLNCTSGVDNSIVNPYISTYMSSLFLNSKNSSTNINTNIVQCSILSDSGMIDYL